MDWMKNQVVGKKGVMIGNHAACQPNKKYGCRSNRIYSISLVGATRTDQGAHSISL